MATSAVREAKNRDEIVRRVREEAGLRLEVISGMEEARLITLGVLWGKPPSARSLCIDIGGGSTEVASALGDTPNAMWLIPTRRTLTVPGPLMPLTVTTKAVPPCWPESAATANAYAAW